VEGIDGTKSAIALVDFFAHLDPTPLPVMRLIERAVTAIGSLGKLWGQGSFCGNAHDAVESAAISDIQVRWKKHANNHLRAFLADVILLVPAALFRF